MAPLHSSKSKVLLLYLLLFVFTSLFLCTFTQTQTLPLNNHLSINRRVLQEDQQPIKKKPISLKNQTKLVKPTTTDSTKNKTKLIKPTTTDSTKNKTKLTKPTTESTRPTLLTIKTQLKKLNSTSKPTNSTKPTSKSTNSTKPNSNLLKKPSDLTKSSPPKTKNMTKTLSDSVKNLAESKPKSKNTGKPQIQTKQNPNWIDEDDEDDLVSGFRDLPSKFQESLLPDLEKISTTSQLYLDRANKEITKGFKPIVGKKYAPTIASVVSLTFILIPLILVSLIFNKIKAYFSLQKLLIFIQIYLSIYFSILCSSSLITGLEPLRFFYATSQSTYVCLQVLQTLAYVLYLLLLLMYLVLVFSTESGLGLKLLGLGQTFVGFAVGLHYYMTVFHRAVLRQQPLSSWRSHGIYATCFFVICLLATAERRKKAYLEEGGEEGKKN